MYTFIFKSLAKFFYSFFIKIKLILILSKRILFS